MAAAMSDVVRHICLGVSLLAVMTASAVARDSRAPDPQRVLSPTQISENQQRIAMARQLINRQMFEQAAHLLETVYERDPENSVVHNLLKKSYVELK